MLQTCVAPFSIYQCVSAWAIWFPTRAFRPLKSAKKKLATPCYPHTEHTALAVDSRSLCSVCVRRRPCRLPATALSGGSQLHSTIKDLRFGRFCPLPSMRGAPIDASRDQDGNRGQKKLSGVTFTFAVLKVFMSLCFVFTYSFLLLYSVTCIKRKQMALMKGHLKC